MQKKKEQPREELYGDLGRLFDFTRGDLEANRAGFMSKRQKDIRMSEVKWGSGFLFTFTGGILIACLLPVIIFHFLSVMAGNTSLRNLDSPDNLIFLLIILVPLVVGIWFIRYESHKMRIGRVQSIEGHVLVKLLHTQQLGIEINQREFPLSTNEQVDYKWKYQKYKLYFLPESRILSIEEIP